MPRRARSLAFRPVVVYDAACWKDRMVASDSPSVAKANFIKVTRHRRKDKSWSQSHRNGRMMRRWRQTSCGPGGTSFTNEDDTVQAVKKMNDGHEDKGVGKEDNAKVAEANEDNDKEVEATEDKEKETVPDAEAKGGGDESDGDGIAALSGAGEGVREPNADGDSDAGKVDGGEFPRKADEEMVCTNENEHTKIEDEPMQEGEQGGEAKPTEDVNDKPAIPSDTSVAMAEEGKSDEAPKTNTPNK